jgi:hypothetical protein
MTNDPQLQLFSEAESWKGHTMITLPPAVSGIQVMHVLG